MNVTSFMTGRFSRLDDIPVAGWRTGRNSHQVVAVGFSAIRNDASAGTGQRGQWREFGCPQFTHYGNCSARVAPANALATLRRYDMRTDLRPPPG